MPKKPSHNDEEALRKSEELLEKELAEIKALLSAAVMQTPIPMVIVSAPDYIIRMANDAAREFLGIADEPDYTGTSFAEVKPTWQDFDAHGNRIPITELPLSLALRGIDTKNRELNVIRKDGTNKWESVSSTTVRNSSGDIIAAYLIFHDITERKLAEQALRSNAEQYRIITNTSLDGFAITDSNGRLLDVNEAYCRMIGYSRDKLLSLSVADIEVLQKEEEIRKQIKMTMAESQRLETRHRRKDGRIIDVEVSMTSMTESNQLFVFLRDITERKRAEKALEESEARYRNLVEGASIGIVVTAGHTVVFCNRKESQLFGYKDPSDMIGHNIDEFLKQEDLQELAVPGENSAGWDSTESLVTLQGIRPDNRELVIEAHAIPFLYAGENAILSFHSDKTERKKLEEQVHQIQRIESIGRLAGGIAHDFNNILGIIIGHADLALTQVSPDQPLYGHLQAIMKAALKSAELTHQLLAFARKQTVAPRVLDIDETLSSILDMLRTLIGEQINLEWKPSPGLWPVRMDPSQIDQILTNLCVNARDAIPDTGNIVIETENIIFDETYCSYHQECIPGDFVMLSVSDNGNGMDKDTMDNIFEPFFTTKGMGKGTGLGLATVYGIIKQNNGFINVYSEPGVGTTFKLYLPRQLSVKDQTKNKNPMIPVAQGDVTILLVEDEPVMLEMTTLMLVKIGYRVMPVSKPGEAIRIAGENNGRIHLLITDVIMPGMNGRILAKNITACHPETKCLFMSGYTDNVIAHHGVLDDGVNFIQKPFSIQSLAVKVHDVLGIIPEP